MRKETVKKKVAQNQTRKTRNLSRDAKSLAPRFHRLATAIASVSHQSQSANLSHAECEALLEFYLDSERRKEDAQNLYPTVWKHLQSCAQCRESYTLAKSALDTLPDSISPIGSPSALPFVASAATIAAWSKQIRACIAGAPLCFGFIIQPSHLRQRIAPPPAALARGQAGATDTVLLLADTLNLGRRDVSVEIWINRYAHSSEGRLEIAVASSTPLPEPLRVSLCWNEHQYSGILRHGLCSFDRLPISDLENARDLRVEFEAGRTNALTEGENGANGTQT